MNFFASLANVSLRVLIVFSLTLFGIIARKSGFLREEATTSFADVMLNITLPPLVFVSMTDDVNYDWLASGLIAPVISLLLVTVVSVGTMVFRKRSLINADRFKTFQILSAMPNSGFIGFPVILSIWGRQGLIYAVLYDVGTTIAFCSIAMLMMTNEGIKGKSWKALINPSFAAVICGLVLNWMGIKIPGVMITPLKLMGDATVPLAMLLMGYILGGLKFGVNLITWELGAVCFLKLICYPFFAYLLLLPFHINPLVRAVIIVEAAMPSMASTTVLIEKYGGDGEFAATGILATTILSIFTIPLIANL
jgi:predicted permease